MTSTNKPKDQLVVTAFWEALPGEEESVAAILGLLFILAAVRVWFDSGERAARQMFAFSILYLFLLFTLMIVDRAPGLVGGSLA